MNFVALAGGTAGTDDSDREVGHVGLPEAGLHALAVVEFQDVLDLVAGFASSDPGRSRVTMLRPLTDVVQIRAEHGRVEAMRALFTSEAGWDAQPIPDLGAALGVLRVEGTRWTGLDLRGAHTLLMSSRLTHAALTGKRYDAFAVAPLAPVIARLLVDAPMEKSIDRLVDDEGVVRDDASPALRKARKELRGAERELIRLLEHLMAKLDAGHRVDDASVTIRNGRYVIPVRRDGRGSLGGIVHDTSTSGATLFVEPPAAIEAGNRIRELEAEAAREVERVLREATDALRPHREALLDALDALVVLDTLAARARYAVAYSCASATLAEADTGLTIINGRHPLLLATDSARVVPFDLAMAPGERTLLVSGPNTGGKTVLLKAIALLSLMVQSGIPAPVGLGSRIAVYDRFFADIGDEQSLAASLSTFSAHLRNLTGIIRDATSQSLVVIDELGSGTDPVEGAALGGAILETLTRRGTATFATTHLGALKELAHEVEGVVNASLEFDAAALAPTYRLAKGIPGRSYGLSIARRLRMPDDVLTNAERRVPQGERDVAALLADLQQRNRALGEREQSVDERARANATREERLSAREADVREREREAEHAGRRDARRYLLDARHEIDRVVRELREAGAAGLEAAAATARRTVEQRAAAEALAISSVADEPRGAGEYADARDDRAIEVGATVAVATLRGRTGSVLELRGPDALVLVGAVKMTVPIASLHRAPTSGASAPTPVALLGDQPDVVARHEIDVRGFRVSEVDGAVLQAIDDGVRADLHSLRIIHGKGTGALRSRVEQLLRDDRRVTGFRLGLWNEGGAGVTVAELA